MKEEGDGLPVIGRSGRTLGVRVEGAVRDIPVAPNGTVAPASGGMSVALDDLNRLPKPRLPRSLGGEGRDRVFRALRDDLPDTLTVRIDSYPHALVEPAQQCLLADFESHLAESRPAWRKVHD